MPHLEFATFAGQIFWLAVCFIALYVVLGRIILPKITGVIETRGNVISDNLAEAETLNNKANTLEKKQEALLVDTSEKARKLIDESAKKAKTAIEKKRAELAGKLDAKLAAAEKEIAKIEKQSLTTIDKLSAELTEIIVDKFKAA